VGNKLTTILDLDGSKFGRGIKQAIDQVKLADGSLNKLKAGWTGAMAAFAASPTATTAAVVGSGAAMNKAIQAASNLNESINAVTVSYGSQAEAVHRLGEESAQSFGMSQRAFNEFAVTFEMFSQKIAAASGRTQVDVLRDITGRISDIASLKNIDPAEATRTVMSGLAGETEAWRRIGGDVSAATVEFNALKMGLADTVGELTQSDKILSRFSLIMQQTDQYAGDFKDTQGELANQQRTLAAETENLAAALGSFLVPVLSDIVAILIKVASAAEIAADKINDLPGGGSFLDALQATPIDIGEEFLKNLRNLEEGLGFEVPVEIGPARKKFNEIVAATNEGSDSVEDFLDKIDQLGLKVEEVTRKIKAADPTWRNFAEAIGGTSGAAQGAPGSVAEMEAAVEATTESIKEAAEALEEELDAALQRSIDHLHDYERAAFDTADAQETLADAQAELTRLQTEGTVSAEAKASADENVTDAQEGQADAASELADAQGDLADVVASSIPTDLEKAESLRSVEDAARNLEDAIRGVGRAQRQLTRADRNLTDLQKDLKELDAPQVSENFKKTTAYKNAQADAEKAEKRSDLLFKIEDAELGVADAQQGIVDANRAVEDATLKLNDAQAEHNRLMTVGHDVSDAYKSAVERVEDAEKRLRDAVDETRVAQQERDDLYADSIPTAEELADATDNVKRAEFDLKIALEDQAVAFAAQKGAIDGSTTSLALQRQELERIIALNPALSAALTPFGDLLSGLGGGAVFSQVPVSARESLTINVYPATGEVAPAVIVDALRQYDRFNGPR
jgi:hypothetical protein